jgi:hypothetical protein
VQAEGFSVEAELTSPVKREVNQMNLGIEQLTAAYIGAMGEHDFERLGSLLHEDVKFTGPFVTLEGMQQYLGALRRVDAVRSRNDLKRIFVDGDEACAIYDWVTTEDSVVVPSIEWLGFEDNKIKSTRLYFDRETFAPVRSKLMP